MRTVRIVLWVLVAIAAAAFAYLTLKPAAEQQPEGAAINLAGMGGPFTLTGSDGKPFSSSALSGKPHAIFFGFTHCPDVCPTTLARLVKLRNDLGAGDNSFRILFVTVDPERDGPAEMRNYLSLFSDPIVGLTGTQARIPTWCRGC